MYKSNSILSQIGWNHTNPYIILSLTYAWGRLIHVYQYIYSSLFIFGRVAFRILPSRAIHEMKLSRFYLIYQKSHQQNQYKSPQIMHEKELIFCELITWISNKKCLCLYSVCFITWQVGNFSIQFCVNIWWKFHFEFTKCGLMDTLVKRHPSPYYNLLNVALWTHWWNATLLHIITY